MLENKALKYDKLMNVLESKDKKYKKKTKLGERLLGLYASLVPQCGNSGLATVIPFIFDSVRAEVLARHIAFPPDINWRDLIKLLKNDEGDPKFFTPITNYDNFKWNESHFPI